MLRVCQLPRVWGLVFGLHALSSLFSSSNASPWPQDRGHSLVVSRSGYFSGGSGEAHYNQTDTGAYLEVGVTDRLTLGGAATYALQWNDGAFPARSNGFSVAEIFAQHLLFRRGRAVISGRLTAAADTGLTLYRPDGASAPLGVDPALEPALLAGYAFDDKGRTFVGAEAGWRSSLGADADRLRFLVTAGYKHDRHWMALVKTSGSVVTETGDTSWTDYDVYRADAALVYTTIRDRSYEIGISQDLGGRNIATGSAIYFSVWSRF